MTNKEKLIEILKGAERKVKDINPNMPLNEWLDIYADHLLAEGVIVLLYKTGTKIYVVNSRTSDNKNLYIYEDTITQYYSTEYGTIMCLENHLGVPNWNWGNVFLTKEEAKAKLKECEGK